MASLFYNGANDTAEFFTLGSNLQAVGRGGDNVRDTYLVTEHQTATTNLTQDSNATVWLDDGLEILNVVNTSGNQWVIAFRDKNENGQTINLLNSAYVQIGNKIYESVTEFKAFFDDQGGPYVVTGDEGDAPVATQVAVMEADKGNTLASLDDIGDAIEITDFVQGVSKINVKDIFTDLEGGFNGAKPAGTVAQVNKVSYQQYGSDILVYIYANDDDITNAGNITLRLKNPVDGTNQAITALTADDFEGLPDATVFTADVDYKVLSDYDDVAVVGAC